MRMVSQSIPTFKFIGKGVRISTNNCNLFYCR